MAAAGRRDGRTVDRRRGRPGAAGVDRQRGHAQPRPGAAGPRAGHLRRAGAARARPGRHRQDHRHAGAVHAPGPPPAGPSSAWPRRPPPPRCCARRSATDTDTLAKLIHHLHDGDRRTTGLARPRSGPTPWSSSTRPGWPAPSTWPRRSSYITGRGGSVRLIGDDQQLAAIGAGGVLRDIAARHGAVTLSQVMRFTDPRPPARPNHAEGAASLALRDGDPAAIAYYLDHGRVHVGDLTTVTDDAYAAWSADRAAGARRRSCSPPPATWSPSSTTAPAPTGSPRRRTSTQPHRPRASRSPTAPAPRPATRSSPAATTAASAISATDWVKNGDRWTVDAVHDNGALSGHPPGAPSRHITLPAGYVAEHVALGYAATVHAAQGITADTCHTVATGEESRQLLYVAMTRGRARQPRLPHHRRRRRPAQRHHPRRAAAPDRRRHPHPRPGPRRRPRSRRPASDAANCTTRRPDARRCRRPLPRRPHHRRRRSPRRRPAGRHRRRRRAPPCPASPAATPTPRCAPTSRCSPSTGTTRSPRCAAAVEPPRNSTTRRDPAAVLDWRLDPTGRHRPRRRTAAVAAGRPRRARRRPRVGRLPARPRRAASPTSPPPSPTSARAWTPDQRPDLGRPARSTATPTWSPTSPSGAPPTTSRTPTGATPATRTARAAEARAQRDLDQRVTRVLGDPTRGHHHAGRRWPTASTRASPTDPYWPILAERLTAAERAGIDITALAHAVAARRRRCPTSNPPPRCGGAWPATSPPPRSTATEHRVTTRCARLDPGAHRHRRRGRSPPASSPTPPGPPSSPPSPTAATAGWDAVALLDTAHDLLHGGQPDDAPLRPERTHDRPDLAHRHAHRP